MKPMQECLKPAALPLPGAAPVVASYGETTPYCLSGQFLCEFMVSVSIFKSSSTQHDESKTHDEAGYAFRRGYRIQIKLTVLSS